MKGYQKQLIARRLNDLALNMRSIAYQLKLAGKLRECASLYGSAEQTEKWAEELTVEGKNDTACYPAGTVVGR